VLALKDAETIENVQDGTTREDIKNVVTNLL
jgi:ribosomal protein L19E